MRIFLVLLILCISCSSPKEDATLKESIETHELALQISGKVKQKLASIEQLTMSLEDSSKIIFSDSLVAIQTSFEAWESSIVEVPGHEHDHHDHEGHDHNHAPSPELTPEMALEIQKDLRDRAVALNVRAQNLLNILEEQDEPTEKED